MSDRGLTHLDPLGRARMVDVTPKEPTHRRATARCKVFMATETTNKIAANAITKGDVLAVARVAGIQAAKRTPDLIPLCHQLTIGAVYVNFNIGEDLVEVEAQVDTVDRTGVEMEALTACSVAALTVYDMCKSVDRSMVIGELTLWEKTGGRSGAYRRSGPMPSTATSSTGLPSDDLDLGSDFPRSDFPRSDILRRDRLDRELARDGALIDDDGGYIGDGGDGLGGGFDDEPGEVL